MKLPPYVLRYSASQNGEAIYADDIIVHNEALCAAPTLQVLVWNIYKQQRQHSIKVLEKYAKESQLVLLQEAKCTAALLSFTQNSHWIADQVPAISAHSAASGVMSFARVTALQAHSFKQKEPITRLAKSALITLYPLSNGSKLMVANIHAINFSLGLTKYHQQLEELLQPLSQHSGPIILAGDFNAWRKSRASLLIKLIQALNLQEVRFNPDWRKRFFNHPLDFIFYRELTVEQSKVIVTDSSDHNPLFVSFSYLTAPKPSKIS